MLSTVPRSSIECLVRSLSAPPAVSNYLILTVGQTFPAVSFVRHFKSLWTADNRLAFVAKILLSDSWQSARSERNMFTLTCARRLCACVHVCVSFSVPLGTSLSLGFGSNPDSRVMAAAVKLWVVGRVSTRILGGW